MLDDRRLFLTFAEAGSLAQTARLLDVARSTAMRRLQALEDDLGTALVHRAGKRITLTDAGRRYAAALKPVFEALDRAEQDLHHAEGRLVGRLRLSLPFLGATRFLTPMLAAFQRTYPGVTLEVSMARDIRRLGAGSFDVAMQYGTWSNPDLAAQLVYREQLILCASARYLQERGVPEVEADLHGHNVLLAQDLEGRVAPWRRRDGQRIDLPAPVTLTNSLVVAYELMLEDVGIARVPRLLAASALQQGRAVHVLPEIVNEAPVLFVYLPDPSPVTRAFLDIMDPRRFEPG